jgi:Icc-related predicted phosphoesterase
MKFWIFSDLHLDVNARHYNHMVINKPPTDYDAIIVAGDVCERMDRAIPYLQDLQLAQPSKIYYVPGNHEFWHSDIVTDVHEGHVLTRKRGTRNDVTMLYDNRVIVDDVMICGATMWTDFNYFGSPQLTMDRVRRDFSDFWYIKYNGQPFTPERALQEFTETQQFFGECLRNAKTRGLKTVVVSHHAPSALSVLDKYKADVFTSCFASTDVIGSGALMPDLWVHGHVHNTCDYEIKSLLGLSSTRVVCNPYGYGPLENPSFKQSFVVEV